MRNVSRRLFTVPILAIAGGVAAQSTEAQHGPSPVRMDPDKMAGLGLAPIPNDAFIDILVEVKDSSDESAWLPRLEAAGYVLRVREPDWHEHRMLRTPEKDVHVHIYSAGCAEIGRTLAFRDRLRRSVEDRIRYEQTKRELAAKDWPDMNAYAEAKTEVIESILAASRAEEEGPR